MLTSQWAQPAANGKDVKEVFEMRVKVITMIMMIVGVLFAGTFINTEDVSAASVCYNVSGNSKSTTTFYVTTGKSWTNNQYIKFDQKKGVMRYQNWVYKTKTFSMAGMYGIAVKDLSRGGTKYYDMDSTWAVKIKLRAKTKYRISVSPKPMYVLRGKYAYKGYLLGWKKHSTWTVKKTKNITFCR